MQCDCIVLITVRKAEDQAKAELEVKSSYANLLWVNAARARMTL
jgi:hypothetical protein